MVKTKKRKQRQTHNVKTKPAKPINCANCHEACAPSLTRNFTDTLPTTPDTSAKKRKSSKANKGQVADPVSINDALAAVFFIHDPGLGQSPLALCTGCAFILAEAWNAVTRFRRLALHAPMSFLAPFLCQVKV